MQSLRAIFVIRHVILHHNCCTPPRRGSVSYTEPASWVESLQDSANSFFHYHPSLIPMPCMLSCLLYTDSYFIIHNTCVMAIYLLVFRMVLPRSAAWHGLPTTRSWRWPWPTVPYSSLMRLERWRTSSAPNLRMQRHVIIINSVLVQATVKLFSPRPELLP